MDFMRVVVVLSEDGDALDLACRLRQEGNEVRIAIQDKEYSSVGNGFGLKRVRNWRDELSWVGKDGLIIFDQSGFGKDQDELREKGYSVFGGSEGGDRLEFERANAQEIFARCGMKTVPSLHFSSVDDAGAFVKGHWDRWVVKQNGHADKCFSYDGKLDDCRDVVNLLENYKKYNRDECYSIDLQQRVEGVELAATRYFNGTDWVGPIMMNMEHKELFPGGLGPRTDEMGTLMWFDDDENNKLFLETLSKITSYLREIKFRGCFDINCIVNEQGAVPLEATPRFGYPTIHVETALMLSPWGEFLKAVADGGQYEPKWRKGFGIVFLLAVPPFPYQAVNNKYNPHGLRIYFRENPSAQEWPHLHFSEVSKRHSKDNPDECEYVVSGSRGYVMCISGFGKTVRKARENAHALAKKVFVPKMFYRNDIGLKFIEKDRALLEKWGYIRNGCGGAATTVCTGLETPERSRANTL